jgi:hypothetical protein
MRHSSQTQTDWLVARLRGIARRRTAVHDVRVVLKILRAGLKLCGEETRGAKTRLRRLRARARALAAVRNAESRREVIAWLRARKLRVAPLRPALRPARGAIAARVRRAVADATAVAGFLDAALRALGPSRLTRRLNHFARRIAKAQRRYRRTPTPENLHRLRKRVKDHQYQMRYWAPPAARHPARQRRLQRAGQDLGLAHDLLLLRDDLAAARSGPRVRQQCAAIEALARRRSARAVRRLRGR